MPRSPTKVIDDRDVITAVMTSLAPPSD